MRSFRPANLAWFALATLVAGAYLFQVPGYHFDEAWFAQYGARIAFEKDFWPLHGMNLYTMPVLPYLIGGFFKLNGHGSLELARVLYLILNLLSFLLFYTWVKARRPRSAWVFAILWCTMPLSVFNQRLNLEVTTGFALFAGLALWGFTDGLFGKKRIASLVVGVLAILAGIASHVLFFGVALGLLWAAWKHAPEEVARKRVKWAATGVLLPTLALFLQAALASTGSTAGVKALVATFAVLALLGGVWSDALRDRARVVMKPGSYLLNAVAAVGFFFFALFELSGIWPTSQSTGQLSYLFLLPGLYLVLATIGPARAKLEDALEKVLFELWLVSLAITVLSVYKPSSARYWELPLLGFLLLAALTWRPLLNSKKFAYGLAAVCVGNLALLGADYFAYTLLTGARSEPYRFLWVRESAHYHRPVVPAYESLAKAAGPLCAEDAILVDDGRNATVLEIHREFVRANKEELPCARLPRKFLFSAAPPAEGALLVGASAAAGLGDLRIYELPTPESSPNASGKLRTNN